MAQTDKINPGKRKPKYIPYIKPFISGALVGGNKIHGNDKLKRLLSNRRRYYNRRFKINVENLEKFEKINQLLRIRSREAYLQAEKIENYLLRQMQQPGSYVFDYEIEFSVELWAEKKYGHIEELEGNPFFKYEPTLISYYKKSRIDQNDDDSEHKRFLFEDDLNEYPETFKGQRHCSLLHDLYDHTYLSFQDIVDIEAIWIEVFVRIQNYTKVEQ